MKKTINVFISPSKIDVVGGPKSGMQGAMLKLKEVMHHSKIHLEESKKQLEAANIHLEESNRQLEAVNIHLEESKKQLEALRIRLNNPRPRRSP